MGWKLSGRERERERGWKRANDRKTGSGAGMGTERERERGWRREDERKMRTGTGAETGAGTVARAIAETGTGTGDQFNDWGGGGGDVTYLSPF